MIIPLIIYALIGVVSCFTSLVILKVNDLSDEALGVIYPLFSLIVWPVTIPLTIGVYIIIGLANLADVAADRIKDNRRKK